MKSVEQYPVLGELPAIETLPRTQLYRLEPIGMGTGSRESLTSYVERLAWEHHVTVRDFCTLPAASARIREDGKLKRLVTGQPFFNAGLTVTQRWIEFLQENTRCTDLNALTLMPLAAAVNTSGLMARERRWCPLCPVQNPYAHLLWDIAVVSACPIHEVELVAGCACTARSKWRRVARRPVSCVRCGRPLEEVLHARKTSNQSVRISRLVHTLLAHPAWETGGWSSARNTRVFLERAASVYFQGEAAHLAQAIGVAKSSLHDWMSGRRRPSLSWLVATADRFGCDIADVLNGATTAMRAPATEAVRVHRRKYRSIDDKRRARLAEELRRATVETTGLSLAALARRLKVEPASLRKLFPRESAAIVARWQQDRRNKRSARREQAMVSLRAKAEELAAQGILPTARRVRDQMPLPARYAQFHAEFNEVLRDVRHQFSLRAVRN